MFYLRKDMQRWLTVRSAAGKTISLARHPQSWVVNVESLFAVFTELAVQRETHLLGLLKPMFARKSI